MKLLTSASATALALLTSLATAATADSDACTSHSQPNPIWQSYPGNVTGTVNGTIALLPIPYALARSIIPAKYAILSNAWRSLLPDLPSDTYPALWQSIRDHDLHYGEYQLADFSRVSIEFPFVDLLGDGYSSFRWSPHMLLTAGNDMAIQGAGDYGTAVHPAVFDPPCNAYEHSTPSAKDVVSTYFRAQSVEIAPDGSPAAHYSALFTAAKSASAAAAAAVPASFFANATNQPVFANGTACDNYMRVFNTHLSTGTNAGVPVRARIDIWAPDLFGADKPMHWADAVGMQIDTAFIENHLVSCKGLGSGNGPSQTIEIRGAAAAGTAAYYAAALSSFVSQGIEIGSVGVGHARAALSEFVVSPVRQAVLRLDL